MYGKPARLSLHVFFRPLPTGSWAVPFPLLRAGVDSVNFQIVHELLSLLDFVASGQTQKTVSAERWFSCICGSKWSPLHSELTFKPQPEKWATTSAFRLWLGPSDARESVS